MRRISITDVELTRDSIWRLGVISLRYGSSMLFWKSLVYSTNEEMYPDPYHSLCEYCFWKPTPIEEVSDIIHRAMRQVCEVDCNACDFWVDDGCEFEKAKAICHEISKKERGEKCS